MRIEIIKCLQDNYSYLLIDDNKNIGCVVDPGEAAPIIKYVESNNIESVSYTHLRAHET